jgi:CRP/FNR family transcriptional regulator
LLGTLGAEARVARFLIMLSERFASLGFSPFRFNLRMTRQEIGSYLGLTLETVSRAFSALKAASLIRVNQKAIEIESLDALRTMGTISTPVTAKPPFH